MIYAVGVNHHSAPVAVRERLHLSDDEITAFLRENKGKLFREASIISTCNRTEFYALPMSSEVDGDVLIQALRSLRSSALIGDEHFFRFMSCGAVSHLFKVASAVDSQILGDMQILAQVKHSYELALLAGSIATVFNHLYMGAFHTGKRVRNETAVGIGAVSVSFAAVELARKIFSDLHDKHVLIVGSGETAALAARHLLDKGVDRLSVTSRTYDNAVALAGQIRARAIRFENFANLIHEFDIVVSATSSPSPVVTHDAVKHAMKKRQNRPLLMLDLAVPRDVEPRVNDLPNVFLRDLDSIQSIIDQNIEQRRAEIPKVNAIATEEVVNFFVWYNTLEATPTIQQLREKFEQVRAAEVDKFRNRIEGNSLDAVELLTRRIVNKLLHPAMVSIRKPVYDGGEISTRIQVVRDLFDLEGGCHDATKDNGQE